MIAGAISRASAPARGQKVAQGSHSSLAAFPARGGLPSCAHRGFHVGRAKTPAGPKVPQDRRAGPAQRSPVPWPSWHGDAGGYLLFRDATIVLIRFSWYDSE